MLGAFIGEAIVGKTLDSVFNILQEKLNIILAKNENCLSSWDKNILISIFDDFYSQKLLTKLRGSQNELNIYNMTHQGINEGRETKLDDFLESFINAIINGFETYNEKIINTLCLKHNGQLKIDEVRYYIKNDSQTLKLQLTNLSNTFKEQLVYIYAPFMQGEEMTKFILNSIQEISNSNYYIDELQDTIIENFVPYNN